VSEVVPDWFLYVISIVSIVSILVDLAVFVGLVIVLRLIRAQQPQLEKQKITSNIPPLTEEEQKLIWETQQLKQVQAAIEKELNPLGSPEGYWEAFKAIRSKRIQLDLLEAQLDALEAKKKAEKKLAEREEALKKRAVSNK